ncbi:hypothetical protein IAE39_005050 [Pseudomonas sp. S37]|uniref:hypothetical protein n=1 Tax=Pseudomonas sp. S37 TaxID=2767449 RepID=UPI0019128055|nr:hypothetical protein [Pseudomonas sp. S37]MBK4996876.1 hypothetical protein [Pseudomonas sp. S37]
MPVYYRFVPKASFIAKVWWQMNDTYVEPGNWDQNAPGIVPVWMDFDGKEGMEAYMRSEPLDRSQNGEGVVADCFWFGVYEGRLLGSGYYYQVRPALWRLNRPPKIMKYVMEADLAGYMAMYISLFDSPESTIIAANDLWRLEGLVPTRLTAGSLHHNLTLATFDDFAVKRYMQFGQPYLNSKASGQHGRVTLEIIEYPFQ